MSLIFDCRKKERNANLGQSQSELEIHIKPSNGPSHSKHKIYENQYGVVKKEQVGCARARCCCSMDANMIMSLIDSQTEDEKMSSLAAELWSGLHVVQRFLVSIRDESRAQVAASCEWVLRSG